jgi:hypothetical protein
MAHAPLHPDTRNLLAREILKAREAAEAGAKASLAALRVGEASPAEGMTAAERSLRNRLRANGRQLGDNLLADGKQELGYLVEEVAYQHWHRMLFARFLAENGLLREDQGDQPIDLAECEALANAEGLDIWAYAARCAQKMLPGVFRLDDPKLELRLDTPKQLELNVILKALPSQVFTATDALGWVYQYWQAKRKDEVNASGVKIGAKEISPVTQLFTEDYMVDFLLHNTLGAWWAGKMGPIEATDESEARAKAGLPAKDGLPAVEWTYLRFVQDSESKKWTPASGIFGGWPRRAKDITFLDPCMGSGHFPAFALPILARMRMDDEGGNAATNLYAVLKSQIHGLELDQRCCQIGAFNLALTAWKLGGFQQLPSLNIACCGVAPQAELADWVRLAGDDDKLRSGMTQLYKLFQQAPVLGSLINPLLGKGDLLTANSSQIRPLLDAAVAVEVMDAALHEMKISAKGISEATEILSAQYSLVATNVPYLARTRHPEELAKYVDRNYKESRTDLATVFIRRCLELSGSRNAIAVVTPQNWNFQDQYEPFRSWILSNASLQANVQLGAGAFESITGEVVKPALLIASSFIPEPRHLFLASDCSAMQGVTAKSQAISRSEIFLLSQSEQKQNPRSRILVRDLVEMPVLKSIAGHHNGICSGDLSRFTRCFVEVGVIADGWATQQTTTRITRNFSGMQNIFWWQGGSGDFFRFACERLETSNPGAWVRGKGAWGKRGVIVSAMGSLQVSRYLGDLFDDNTVVLVPHDEKDLPALWEFCSSPEYAQLVRTIDQSLKVRGPLVEVPFDVERWSDLAARKHPCGLPVPHSSDPTQWLFSGHPHKSENPLQVAVARLLCYQWPRQTGSSFPDCPALGPDGLEKHADDDGIVALSPINREEAAAVRLRDLLKDAYGAGWQDGVTERQLLSDAGHGAATLEEWLRDSFFEEHCKLFHHRPFIWHIWDGENDGFHVLVNYHRLAAGNGDGTRLLQKLATTYLGDWIARCTQEVAADKPGAARRLKAAQDLQADLRKILEGEAPNDIFVRWKPLGEQAIGWAPDINDGVRLNIRPFLAVRDVGKKGAGLLRFKPNVKWDKDRGKEPQRPKSEFPWFWSCDPESNPQHATDYNGGSTFTGERWNELHYTLAAKRAARASRT